MLKWSTQDRITVWGKPKCLHTKVGHLSCYECPESGFVAMDHLGKSIKNKQDLLKDIKDKYVNVFKFCDMY